MAHYKVYSNYGNWEVDADTHEKACQLAFPQLRLYKLIEVAQNYNYEIVVDGMRARKFYCIENTQMGTLAQKAGTTLITEEDWANLPPVVYHGTGKEMLNKIGKRGLGAVNGERLPGYDYTPSSLYSLNGFFFDTDDERAEDWAYDSDCFEDVVVLAIPKTILKPQRLFYDSNHTAGVEKVDSVLEHRPFILEGVTNPTDYITYFYQGVIKDIQKYAEVLS